MPENPEIWKAVAMADHFDKIQKLPEPLAGVPNFRRVPGYKVRPWIQGPHSTHSGGRMDLVRGEKQLLRDGLISSSAGIG